MRRAPEPRRSSPSTSPTQRPRSRPGLPHRPHSSRPHPDHGRVQDHRPGPAVLPARRRAVRGTHPAAGTPRNRRRSRTRTTRRLDAAPTPPHRPHSRSRGRHQHANPPRPIPARLRPIPGTLRQARRRRRRRPRGRARPRRSPTVHLSGQDQRRSSVIVQPRLRPIRVSCRRRSAMRSRASGPAIRPAITLVWGSRHVS